MDIEKSAEDPETIETRPHAVSLLRRGLTPQIVQQAIRNTHDMEGTCRRHGVHPDDIVWLAARWPIRRGRRT